jgi:hypothetical protein
MDLWNRCGFYGGILTGKSTAGARVSQQLLNNFLASFLLLLIDYKYSQFCSGAVGIALGPVSHGPGFNPDLSGRTSRAFFHRHGQFVIKLIFVFAGTNTMNRSHRKLEHISTLADISF